MKKLLITTIALALGLTLSTNPTNAQSFGVKGGASIAKLTFSGGGASISSDSKTGFLFGAYYSGFELSSSFVLQPELLFVQKGAETSVAGQSSTTTLNYIEIPVLAKYGFGTGGSFTPYAAAGPYLGFNIKAEAESGGNTTDISDSVSGTDFGVALEAGADISSFNIGLRYDLGLSNIDDTGSSADQTTRAWLITAGYSF